MITFGSVCSGIEAASVAWHPLGWKAAWLAEIEPFPCSLLAHHYPDVPNYGDMTQLPKRILSGEITAPDIFCGGTPCQAFSVAGLRNSLDDARGNLSLTFCRIADAIDACRPIRPTIVFWENVPGVLSTKDNAFGCFLAALAGEDDALIAPGGRWANAGCVFGPKRTVAWRVLDAQYFGVAQRRRRVFVVASARKDFDPAEVLFEFDGVRRDSAPSRSEGKEVAGSITQRIDRGGVNSEGGDNHIAPGWPATICSTLDTTFGTKMGLENQHVNAGCPMFVPAVANTLGASPSCHSSVNVASGQGDVIAFDVFNQDLTGQVSKTVASRNDQDTASCIALHENQRGELSLNDTAGALSTGGGKPGQGYPAIAFTAGDAIPIQNATRGKSQNGIGIADATAPMYTLDGASQHGIAAAMQVRRLTPTECERLQGFPDGYTNVPHRGKPAADGNRYKALGNSWAVPVVRWIGERIQNAIA